MSSVIRPVTNKSTWDVRKLIFPDVKARYEELISAKFGENWRVGRDVDEQWDYFCTAAFDVAQVVGKKTAFRRDSTVQAAYDAMNRQLKIVSRARLLDLGASYDSTNDSPPLSLPGALADLRSSRQAYMKIVRERKIKEFESVLDDLNELTHIGARVQMAFKFLKPARRALQSSTTNVSLRDWHHDLQKWQGESVHLIMETDHFPLLRLPSVGDVLDVLSRMRNGKSPGIDLMAVEMLKASSTLTSALHKIICDTYRFMKVPVKWQTTVSHPIPKKPQPKTTDEYRKITLCSVGYKIHASLLLQQIKPFLPLIDDYQSGFLPNRSCDDLVFEMKQVLDIRWNHGLPTYVLSLDLEKAFDMIRIDFLPEILLQYGVPHYLINLLVISCMHEQNCISWMGERTAPINKSRGVKQGCPISPYLFNVILDWVMKQLKSRLSLYGIELFTGEKDKDLNLPMVLTYADDTSFLAENVQQLERILVEFIPILAHVGMKINVGKSSVIVKEGTNMTLPTTISIAGSSFKVVTTAKVLGVSITSSAHRRDFIRERCNGSIRLFKSLLPSLKKLRAPIDTLMCLYHSLICPSLVYGHKSGSMTEANRRSLMHRELQILRDLVSVAHPVPKNRSVFQLLDRKTINRKISVYRIRYYGHISRRRSDTLLQKAKNFRLTSKRRVGRPRYTFNDTLTYDFGKFPLVSPAEWDQSIGNVDDLKKLTSVLYAREDLDDDPMNIELMLYSSDEEE